MNDLDQELFPSVDDQTTSKPNTIQLQKQHKRNILSKGLCLLLTAVISFSIGAGLVSHYAQQEYEKQWLGGYGTGKDAGYDLGYTDGSAKVQQSYDDGYKKGHADGYNDGHEDGYDFGYDTGYDEGHEQGYLDGLVVGASYTPYRNSTSSSSYTTQTTQSVTVYVTDTGSKYHRSGCRYLYDSSTPISLSKAKAAGYTPCSRCNPPSWT